MSIEYYVLSIQYLVPTQAAHRKQFSHSCQSLGEQYVSVLTVFEEDVYVVVSSVVQVCSLPFSHVLPHQVIYSYI
nr:MAG TPA: hypothetical protein [Caudoviricetes sp.]